MARLGELLVSARLLTTDQVERALRAQVMWGGRLGTNLVELGFIELDPLARALGRKHDMPAALGRHFDKADPDLQARLDPGHADMWSIVPLLRVAGGGIAIASADPQPASVRIQIASILGIAPHELVVSVAPEQRLRYQLERVYGIARSARFLRASAAGPVALLETVPEPVDPDEEISVPIDVATPVLVARPGDDDIPEPELDTPPADDLAALIDDAISQATAPTPPPPDESGARDRRGYVKTLADPPALDGSALGRIAIRRAQSGALPVIESAPQGASLQDATRAIRRSPNRDRVAELVVDTLVRFAPMCPCGLVAIVRGDLAIAWKHFSRAGDGELELAVPMNQAGLLPTVVASGQTARCSRDELGPIDQRLLEVLGAPHSQLVVVPVPIAGKVMCMIVTAVTADADIEVVEQVAQAASTAFMRLVRDSGR